MSLDRVAVLPHAVLVVFAGPHFWVESQIIECGSTLLLQAARGRRVSVGVIRDVRQLTDADVADINAAAATTRAGRGESALTIDMALVSGQGIGALMPDRIAQTAGWVRITLDQYAAVLERAIVKIGHLLALGFGEAGTNIIG